VTRKAARSQPKAADRLLASRALALLRRVPAGRPLAVLVDLLPVDPVDLPLAALVVPRPVDLLLADRLALVGPDRVDPADRLLVSPVALGK
jgi:hypothetical protein